MLYIRPDAGLKAQECNLRVSIQPLRLNVDQVISLSPLKKNYWQSRLHLTFYLISSHY